MTAVLDETIESVILDDPEVMEPEYMHALCGWCYPTGTMADDAIALCGTVTKSYVEDGAPKLPRCPECLVLFGQVGICTECGR